MRVAERVDHPFHVRAGSSQYQYKNMVIKPNLSIKKANFSYGARVAQVVRVVHWCVCHPRLFCNKIKFAGSGLFLVDPSDHRVAEYHFLSGRHIKSTFFGVDNFAAGFNTDGVR